MRDRASSDAIAEGKVKAPASILSRAARYLRMWLWAIDDAGTWSDVYGDSGAPYPSRSGMPEERLTGNEHDASVAMGLQCAKGEPENMSTSFLVWFCDLKARALGCGIAIEELTVREVREYA